MIARWDWTLIMTTLAIALVWFIIWILSLRGESLQNKLQFGGRVK